MGICTSCCARSPLKTSKGYSHVSDNEHSINTLQLKFANNVDHVHVGETQNSYGSTSKKKKLSIEEEQSLIEQNLQKRELHDSPHLSSTRAEHDKSLTRPTTCELSKSITNNTNTNTNTTEPNTDAVAEIPLSVQTVNVLVSNCGYSIINGEYRYFVPTQRWCLFSETISFSLVNKVDVALVYEQLQALQGSNMNFHWDPTVEKCWVVSEMTGDPIYYAAPQLDDDSIPVAGWISVHGSHPVPKLEESQAHATRDPSIDEKFGNLAPISETRVGNEEEADEEATVDSKADENTQEEVDYDEDEDDDESTISDM